MNINGQRIDKGININDKTQAFTEQILEGLKDIETRNSNSLRSLIGKRVALIRTGCGPAMIVGLVDIVGWKLYRDVDHFRADYKAHRVAAGSSFDITKSKTRTKYGYMLCNVERCDPIPVTSKGIVIRNI